MTSTNVIPAARPEDLWEGMEAIEAQEPPRRSRVVNLVPFLDGTYVPPTPSVGALRQDHVRMLYPGKWHTVIGLTTAGKSWLALWHALDEIRRGNTVAYAHFEETSPAGTIARLRALGCPDDAIRDRFVWLDCSTRWEPGEFAAALPEGVALVVLDGINAACSQHGWPVDKPEGAGNYRARFVTPATIRNAAVLSLGHPPKSRDRQGERHSFGSTAWLDEVDGVGFRLEASKKSPIRSGQSGCSALYSVKDRPGEVERHGKYEDARESGWYYLGQFIVDSSPGQTPTAAYVTAPRDDEDNTGAADTRDSIDQLAETILTHLRAGTGRFESGAKLGEQLRADKVTFGTKDVAPALTRLAAAGRIEWPEVQTGRSRPGWLCEEVPPDNDPN